MMDPRGDFGIPGAVIGGISGAVGGFLGGIQSSNVWAGVAGGAFGGAAGAVTGAVLGPATGGITGSAIGGTMGGFIGGMVGKHLSNPNASDKEKLLAGAKGAGIGLITGTIAGKIGTALKTVVGASGAAVEIAKDMITAPIALGLGLIDFESAFDIDKQTQEGINVPTIPEEYTPLPAPELQYDPSNPDEINPNSSISLNVVGGCPPYTLSVSGNGFSMTGKTLFVDDTACGSATITVTDACGNNTTGYVRCTAGKWGDIEEYGTYCNRPPGPCPNISECGALNDPNPRYYVGKYMVFWIQWCIEFTIPPYDYGCDAYCGSWPDISDIPEDNMLNVRCPSNEGFDCCRPMYKSISEWICE